MSGTSSASAESVPAVPQPQAQGDIVGLVLQNAQGTALPSQYVSFGQVFAAGAVLPSAQLVAQINGQTIPVQMDVKTTNADGSVAMAVLTLLQPALAAGASAGVMLSLAPAATTAPAPVNVASEMAAHGYDLAVNLAIQGGSTYTLNVANLLSAAAPGSVTKLMSGPQATELQFQTDVTSSLRMVFNVTAYADGTFKTDVQFNNDLAMQPTGGTLTYSATITQGGATAYQVNNLTQYQYEDWNKTIYTGSAAPGVNVQHDIAYLERAGAIPNYDYVDGAPASYVATEASQIASAGWNAPLGSDGITEYMPMTGGRADIGPTTSANAIWLMTQDPTAAQFALGQAQAGAGVPWNFYNPQAGTWLNTSQYTSLQSTGWGSGVTTLTQGVNPTNNGWTPDVSHQPDLFYDAYLLTGNQTYLDALNAQASYGISSLWPAMRDNAIGDTTPNNVIFGNQLRGAAWTLRQVDEAAYANPTGSAEKAYFTTVMNDNWSWLASQLPSLTKLEGQAAGWIPAPYGNPVATAPWMQDYFVSTAVEAAQMGNQNAVTYLKWATNFIAGAVLNLGSDGINYNLDVYSVANAPTSNGQIYWSQVTNSWAYWQPLTTWTAIEQNQQAAGNANGTSWAESNGDYGALQMQALAGIITITQSTEAMQAFAEIAGSGAPYTSAAAIQAQSQFDIVPRMPDGHLLTLGNLFTFDSTAPGIDRGAGTADQLIVEMGNANVTLAGGNGGANILAVFGTGNDVLQGGSQGNFIFGGPGADTIIGGGGANYMKAGTGPTTFILNSAVQATDTIDGFNLSNDHIDIVGSSGQALEPEQISAIIAGATTDAAGNAVLSLGSGHVVTLDGIALSQLSPSLFAAASAPVISGSSSAVSATLPPPTSPPPVTSSSSGTGPMTLTSSGQSVTGGSSSLTVIDQAGGNTVMGGSGGLVFSTTAGGDLIQTASGATDTIDLALASTVVSNGTDVINGGTLGANQTITANGAATITGSTGSNVYTLNGVDSLASNGTDTVKLGQGAQATIAATASLSVTEAGASLSLSVAGNGTVGISGGAATISGAATVAGAVNQGLSLTTGTTGGVAVTAGNGLLSINSAGADTIHAGSGNMMLNSLAGANDTVTGGSGALLAFGPGNVTFTGGTGSADIGGYPGSTLDVTAGSGAVTVIGGSSVNFVAGSGTADVVEYAGNETIAFGSGSATVIGGTGTDTYTVLASQGGGTETIYGYDPTKDQLKFQGFTGNPIASEAVTGGALAIGLVNGTTLILPGITDPSVVGPEKRTLTNSGQSVTGGSSSLTVIDQAGGNTVMGGSGGLVFSTTAGGDLIQTASGATDTIDLALASTVVSNGTDVINGGTVGANQTITANGAATITGSTGSNVYTLNGIDSLASKGTDTVKLGQGAQATITATKSVSVTETGASVSLSVTGNGTVGISGGTATISGAANQGDSLSTSATGGVAVTAGSGGLSVVSAGADTIHAGSGNLMLTSLAGANDTVTGGAGAFDAYGSGNLTFTGGSGSANITGYPGSTLNVTAGSGNVTLVGGSSVNFTAGSGSAIVVVWTGTDHIELGSGSTTILGGMGTDTYEFAAGHGGGSDTIYFFNPNTSTLQFKGFSSNPVQSQTLSPGGLHVALTDGTQINLPGMTTMLSSSMIHLT